MEIKLNKITKRYGSTTVVDSLDLTIEKGAFHFLLGPSGCGKTTTLRMIAGLESVTEGQILFGGKDVTKSRAAERQIGMVFQNYALWPHMTVKQNIEYGLKIKKFPEQVIKDRLKDVLQITQLTRFTERYPGQLSGGQQQRVALARAIAIQPTVLLLDEPLSNLDAKLRYEMRENIARIHKETKITTVYVTHDQKEALSLGTNISVLYSGKLIQSGAPRELYMKPKNSFVASFIGETNLIDGVYRGFHNDLHEVETVLGTFYSRKSVMHYEKDQPVCLSIRPESIKIKLPDRPLPEKNISVFKAKLEGSVYFGELEQLTMSYADNGKMIANLFNIGDYNVVNQSELTGFVSCDHICILPERTSLGLET